VATYVLIHGGHHGSWCWDKVATILRKKGHLVEAPDLPGHGKDKTPIHEVTLRSCVDKVCNVINTSSEPVILVGHSMGGLVISQVAEQIPDKIRFLVYLTAQLLQDGESMAPKFESLHPLLNLSQDQSYFTVRSELVANLFYNDCSADDIARANALLCPEAKAILTTSVHLSNEKFGRIPRIYIECLLDQACYPGDQKVMYTATPCLRVISLNTGHSPFLSAPEQLVACLLSLVD
jgi:pimeloyl-ACP methyl ester carboxylesterase